MYPFGLISQCKTIYTNYTFLAFLDKSIYDGQKEQVNITANRKQFK